MTLIINFFGGPGCGKSTMAAGVFYELKRKKMNVELVTEFAKDLVWEKRNKALHCQPYVFGKQLHKIERLIGQTDYIVTDCPILLSVIYNSGYPKSFSNCVIEIFNSMKNINYLIDRGDTTYESIGRNENFAEAVQIDEEIKQMLIKNEIEYKTIIKDFKSINTICDDIIDGRSWSDWIFHRFM